MVSSTPSENVKLIVTLAQAKEVPLLFIPNYSEYAKDNFLALIGVYQNCIPDDSYMSLQQSITEDNLIKTIKGIVENHSSTRDSYLKAFQTRGDEAKSKLKSCHRKRVRFSYFSMSLVISAGILSTIAGGGILLDRFPEYSFYFGMSGLLAGVVSAARAAYPWDQKVKEFTCKTIEYDDLGRRLERFLIEPPRNDTELGKELLSVDERFREIEEKISVSTNKIKEVSDKSNY